MSFSLFENQDIALQKPINQKYYKFGRQHNAWDLALVEFYDV